MINKKQYVVELIQAWANLAILFISCLVKPSVGWDWCSDDATCIKDGEKVKNTMCTMQANTENECYTDIRDATDEDVRRSMLTWHNTYRDKLANGEIRGWPKAADMRQITYDKELETVALRWAFQTVNDHDKCRSTETYKDDVGQNCGILWNTPGTDFRNISRVFWLWINEISLTDSSIVDNFKFDAEYGHFTAVVWATSYKIGCGKTTFQPKEGGSCEYSKYSGTNVVCNIAPHGNIWTYKMYTQGEPCTACPKNTACNPKSTHPHLCAAPGDPADEIPDYIPARGGKKVVHYYWALAILMVSRALGDFYENPTWITPWS